MVKNTKGGSGHKSMGRKFVQTKQSAKTRFSMDEDEVYAQVIKLCGNGMCHVICHDGDTRLCHIRGKFRGRGKRDNMVAAGTWLLVGKRGFESEKEGKLENCDLLEVYTSQDKEVLKAQVRGVDWRLFVVNDANNTFTPIDADNIVFSDAREDEYLRLVEDDINGSSAARVTLTINEDYEGQGEEIDIDDI
jgi:initiation factor 1A